MGHRNHITLKFLGPKAAKIANTVKADYNATEPSRFFQIMLAGTGTYQPAHEIRTSPEQHAYATLVIPKKAREAVEGLLTDLLPQYHLKRRILVEVLGGEFTVPDLYKKIHHRPKETLRVA